MPIVASMGGNAGMQTLAVTIRAIAKKEISSGNFLKIVTKEFVIGVLNGVIFAIIAGVVVQFWFKEMDLSILNCCCNDIKHDSSWFIWHFSSCIFKKI